MRIHASCPTLAEPTKGAPPLAPVRVKAARAQAAENDAGASMRAALAERAMRPVQAKSAGYTWYADVVEAARTAGSLTPDVTGIPGPTRAKMEDALGADFSDVRVHPASARAVELGALAFTQGSDIHVAPGQWAPETTEGQELLGHELGHVLQQRAGRVRATAQLKGAGLNDEPALETEADAIGARAAHGSTSGRRRPPEASTAPRSGDAPIQPRAAAPCAACASSAPCAECATMGHEPTQRKRRAEGPTNQPVQRFVAGDITTMSIGPQFARDLTDEELVDQVGILRRRLADGAATSPDHEILQANLRVLEEEQHERNQRRAGPRAQVAGEVARPPGLPLDRGFTLQPMPDVPPELLASLPEGQLVTLPSELSAPGAAAAPGRGLHPTDVTSPLAAGGVGMWGSVNAGLRTFGFQAAGPNAIGLIAIPRLGTPGAMIPGSMSIWGHTATYVRIGGRIQIVRGFMPESLLATARSASAIEQGLAGTPAAIANDVALFTNAGARTLEYPVTAELAQSFARGLPPTGPVGPNLPPLYTARPAVYGNPCVRTNCGLWAIETMEQALGGAVGPVTPQGPVSVTALGESGAAARNTASQGRLINFLRNAEAGAAEVAPVAESTGTAVASSMSRGAQVLRWGGRVFLVVGVATIPMEVAMARPEQRTRTAVGATAGFLTGLAGGAAAGLVCGPGAPACSLVLGLTFGIVGTFTGRAVAEEVYDAATGQP
ncbi:hypothetical protein BE21_04395 [Sorangium cellulosum]|uniref:eCIS core domain-containing protein n=1 Tax=Sorangium cellulosum TaxID=56 RepID=A0A150TGK9_SORCE|nr:hypothetical protein BE21_04395 [Sorangium cellulosum]